MLFVLPPQLMAKTLAGGASCGPAALSSFALATRSHDPPSSRRVMADASGGIFPHPVTLCTVLVQYYLLALIRVHNFCMTSWTGKPRQVDAIHQRTDWCVTRWTANDPTSRFAEHLHVNSVQQR